MTQQDPYGSAPYASDPYAYDPHASQAPAQPSQPYGYQDSTYQPYAQQGYGQPYPQYGYGRPTYHRPAWKIALAVVCFLIAGLALLGSLVAIANPDSAVNSESEGGAAYVFGMFLGFALFVGVPALVGWLLLRTPRRYR